MIETSILLAPPVRQESDGTVEGITNKAPHGTIGKTDTLLRFLAKKKGLIHYE